MDWTMILNDVFAIMELASGCFLVYGGWICLRHLAGDWQLSRQRNVPAPMQGYHAAHAR
ncbi:MAG: hypothetical protein WCE38_25515 [Burkholderiales bacterium]